MVVLSFAIGRALIAIGFFCHFISKRNY